MYFISRLVPVPLFCFDLVVIRNLVLFSDFHSALLDRFGDEKGRREEDRINALLRERKLAASDNEKEKLEWEKDTLFANGAYEEMKTMWEVS